LEELKKNQPAEYKMQLVLNEIVIKNNAKQRLAGDDQLEVLIVHYQSLNG
jgi:hypothetical protein